VERRGSSATGQAFARAGLLGNPSDAYGGRTLAFSVFDFAARVRVTPAERTSIPDPRAERLIAAALARYARHTASPATPVLVELESDIPFQVGLSGSSAIVIATLRALAALYDRPLSPFDQAELALAVEVEDLGIAAGPMDRVTQAYEGLLAMDFRSPRRPESYESLAPALLPAMLIAWHPEGGNPSGTVHSDVRERWQRGDPALQDAMRQFAALADRGRVALRDRDHPALRRAVDANFDLRSEWFPIAERDREMVELARRSGASAKQCGSGGACLIVLDAEAHAPPLIRNLEAAGYATLRPKVERPT